MGTYLLRDEHGGDSEPFVARDEAEAVRLALEHVGEWVDPGDLEASVRIEERLLELLPGGEEREVGVLERTFHPALASSCPGGDEHEWVDDATLYRLVGGLAENPGVWGSGAGVVITDVCRRCGTAVTRDTWCQCGDGEPHEHVFVLEGQYAALEVE